MNRKDGLVGTLVVLLILTSGYSAVITIQPEKTTTVTQTLTSISTAIVYVNPFSGETAKTITQNLTYIYTPASGYSMLSNASLYSIQFAIDSANGTHHIFFSSDSPRTTIQVFFPPLYRNWVFYNNGEVVNPVHFQNNTWSYEYAASFKQGSGELVLYLKQ